MSAFENIETSITGGVTDSLEVVGNLIGSVAPIFSGLFAIYLLLWAFQYWANGGLVEMGVDFFKRLIGWSLVIGFAFNGSEYIQLAKLIYYFSTDLASALTGGSYSTSAMDTNWGIVDNILVELGKKGEELEWYEFSQHISLVFWLVIYRFCLLIYIMTMFVYLLMAKLSLLAVLMVGPLFVGFLLFPATRQYGMNWINQCWNYTIVVVLLVALGKIQDIVFINAMLPALNGLKQGGGDAVLAILLLGGNIGFIFCCTIIFTLVATKVPAIASALTGGSAQVSGIPMRGTMAAATKYASNTNVGGAFTAPFRAVRALKNGLVNSFKPTK